MYMAHSRSWPWNISDVQSITSVAPGSFRTFTHNLNQKVSGAVIMNIQAYNLHIPADELDILHCGVLAIQHHAHVTEPHAIDTNHVLVNFFSRDNRIRAQSLHIFPCWSFLCLQCWGFRSKYNKLICFRNSGDLIHLRLAAYHARSPSSLYNYGDSIWEQKPFNQKKIRKVVSTANRIFQLHCFRRSFQLIGIHI